MINRRSFLLRSTTAAIVGAGSLSLPFICAANEHCPGRIEDDQSIPPNAAAILKQAAAAARARDLEGLLQLTDTKWSAGLGQAYAGKRGLVRLLEKYPDFWNVLAWGMQHVVPERHFMFCSNMLQLNFSAGIAGADGFKARAKPESDAPIIANLSGEKILPGGYLGKKFMPDARIVFFLNWSDWEDKTRPASARKGWIEVRTSDGRKAFVDARDVRHVPYQLIFNILWREVEGQWRMANLSMNCSVPCGGAVD